MYPIVIGGVGGSGTRLVYELLSHAGVFLGNNLNHARDSLPMAAFDEACLRGEADFRLLEECLTRHGVNTIRRDYYYNWGWKHTRSLLTMPILLGIIGQLRFIHVIRDGRDIAYAPHIGFPVFWNGNLPCDLAPDPRTVMALWATQTMLADSYGQLFMCFYYRLRYEDLCHKPLETIRDLYERLDLDTDPATALPLVRPSPTMGRWHGQPDLEAITSIGREALERFGYL